MKKTDFKPGMVMRYVGKSRPFVMRYGDTVRLYAPILNANGTTTSWAVERWSEEDQRFSCVTDDARCRDLVPLEKETA